MLEMGKPVVVDGKTVAIAIPDPKPNLTHLDTAYLTAMRQALLYAVGAATVLALALGLGVGTRLNRELSRLTSAIQSMGDGKLRQEVAVKSRDEIGTLAEAFNRMSTDLARAHDELSESHEKIAKQAALLQEMAIRDKLTGLYNRRHFDEQAAATFAQAERYKRPLTVMIGDIDFFKKINDTFSHATGDEVLRRVGAILQATTRDSDIVARYGGEEFVIAFPETAVEPAASRCEALRLAVESHPWHEVHPDLKVTMSMGLDDDLSVGSFEKMLAAADAKLYVAKHSGRNRVCWKEEATASVEIHIASHASAAV
jgi:diguanylate cyclase (GGDEF)-like protein